VNGLQTSSDALTSKLLRITILRATQMVREGESLHGALSQVGVMPEMALDMVEVGESSGALGPMLTSIAEFYEEEVSLKLGQWYPSLSRCCLFSWVFLWPSS